MTTQKGTYVLLLHLATDKTLPVSGQGKVDFPAGFYAYVNSALDEGGLAKALNRYLKPLAKPLYSIDYLLKAAELEEIWLAAGSESRVHVWVDMLLAIPGGISIIDGFGTDTDECDCETHLVYFDIRPTIEDFEVGMKNRFPNDIIARAYAKNLK